MKLKAISILDGSEYEPYAINLEKKFILYGQGIRMNFSEIKLYCSLWGEFVEITKL